MSIRLSRMTPAAALVFTLALSLLMSTGCDLLPGPSTSDPSRFQLASTLVPNVDLDIYVYVRQEYTTTVPGELIGHPTDVEVESLALWGLATDEEFTIGGALTFVSETDADQVDARIFPEADTWITLSDQTIYFVRGTGAHAETLRTAITNKDFKYYDDLRALAELAILPDGGNTKRGAVAIVKSSDALLELIAQNAGSQIARIIESVAKRLKMKDKNVFIDIDKFGNTSAASIPIALDDCFKQGKIKKGDVVLLAAFGAGLTWGANIIKF